MAKMREGMVQFLLDDLHHLESCKQEPIDLLFFLLFLWTYRIHNRELKEQMNGRISTLESSVKQFEKKLTEKDKTIANLKATNDDQGRR